MEATPGQVQQGDPNPGQSQQMEATPGQVQQGEPTPGNPDQEIQPGPSSKRQRSDQDSELEPTFIAELMHLMGGTPAPPDPYTVLTQSSIYMGFAKVCSNMGQADKLQQATQKVVNQGKYVNERDAVTRIAALIGEMHGSQPPPVAQTTVQPPPVAPSPASTIPC